MVGAPGAGKGTQAERLASRLRLPHVSSGELFRTELREGTDLGREAQQYMERGALVPDELTTRMIGARLSRDDAAQGAILDGYPRTRPQAVALDALLALRDEAVTAAMYVRVATEVLERRLSGRWLCRAADHVYHELTRPPLVPGLCDVDMSELYQRSDDDPATVHARMERQLRPMLDVVGHYAVRGVLVEVDGERPIDEVTEALLQAIAEPAR